MTDAILGTTAKLAGLDGEIAVELKPGAQSADVVTVKDRGITRLRGSGRGDLKVGIQVVTPARLNSKESQLIKEFAESRAGRCRPSSRRSSRGCSPSCATGSSGSSRLMASLYLNPELEPADAELGARVSVGGDEARHAVTVARVRIGERIAIGDGSGFVGVGRRRRRIGGRARHRGRRGAARSRAGACRSGWRRRWPRATATSWRSRPRPSWGSTGVIPWAAERSVSRWEGAKAAKGRERWSSIVREASKQAIRSRVPDVAALASTADLAVLPGVLLVLDPLGDVALTELPLDARRLTLVVGPEGGIAPREFDTLVAAGARRVRLGPEVLRTSTAGPAALAVLKRDWAVVPPVTDRVLANAAGHPVEVPNSCARSPWTASWMPCGSTSWAA